MTKMCIRDSKYAMVLQLVNAAAKLVDFVILDCSSNMTNVFTPAAIESGDCLLYTSRCV